MAKQKMLPVTEEAHKSLFMSKRYGETYSDCILRLTKQTNGGK